MLSQSRIMLLMLLGILILAAGMLGFPMIRYMMYSASDPKLGDPRPAIIGHRGAAGLAPENTRAALTEGLKYANVLEIDVHLTRDGQVVVMHDASVDRTTNGTGELIEMNSDAVLRLDAGIKFGEIYKGQSVPTLADVLTLVGGRAFVLVELKWPREGVYEGLVPKVIEIIRSNGAEGWVQLQSFEPTYLEEAMRLAPEIKCNQLLYGYLNLPPVYQDRRFHFGKPRIPDGINSVVMYYKFLNPSFIQAMHARRIGVATYTVNETEDMIKVLNLGVDAVITDHPERLHPIVNPGLR